jgi:hypothetical protein
MHHTFFDPIVRLRVRPDEPDPTMPPRPRGSRRPHPDAGVEAVRRLIEETTLTYGQIAARTGVGRASICRWKRDGAWKRPPFAPRPTDTVPTARASAHLKRRTLSQRLLALAERHLAELEAAAPIDPRKLAEALELLKIAKLAAMGRRRRRKGGTVPLASPTGEPLRPIAELCAADVDLSRAPRAAIDDYLEHRAPLVEAEKPPRRGRSRRATRAEYHRWLLEKERP